MCVAAFHKWLHEYCPLKSQLSLACRRNTYLWRHPTNNSPMVSNRSDISSAAANAIFKSRPQNIECSFGCMAHNAVLLKSNVANILLFNFCEQKFVQHSPLTIAIDCNGLSLLIFEKKWQNYASGPKSVPNNSGSFWVRQLFNVCMRVFCVPNATILLVYIPPKIKMSFIWKDNFFFCVKIGIFCKSIAGNICQRCSSVLTTIFIRRKDKTNYLSNQTWDKCYHLWNKQ